MSKLAILEEYYLSWKRNNLIDINEILLNIESSINDFDERLSKVESELKELRVIFSRAQVLDERLSKMEVGLQEIHAKFAERPIEYHDEIWVKIRGFAIETRTSSLLNPSRNYRFDIVEVGDSFIRVDKLGKVRLTNDMFISVFQMLRNIGSWVKIGASVRNTKLDSVEGHLKSHFFGGDMSGQMTATWISAILVRSNIGVIFNNKSVGQAIKYLG